MNRLSLWIIVVALVWPVMRNVVFVARFGYISIDALLSSLGFLPMGIASAIILVYLVERAASRSQKASTVFGYVLASPFAFIGGLLSNLVFPSLLGILILGTVPLAIGTVIGYIVSGLMNYEKAAQ